MLLLITFSLFGHFYCVPDILAKRALSFLLARPFVDAVSVIGVIAGAPRDGAAITLADLIGLAFEA